MSVAIMTVVAMIYFIAIAQRAIASDSRVMYWTGLVISSVGLSGCAMIWRAML